MGMERSERTWKTTPEEAAERDAIRANAEREKKKEEGHGFFKEAILSKIEARFAAFAKQHSISYKINPFGEDEISFLCKEDSGWEAMATFLDSEVATFSEMLVTPDGAQVLIYPQKDPAHRVYQITVRG